MISAEEEFEIPESNWGRRAGAYFVDLLLIFMITFAIILFFIPDYFIFLPLTFTKSGTSPARTTPADMLPL